MPQVRETDRIECGVDGGAVTGSTPSDPATARQASSAHDVLDRRVDASGETGSLRHEPEPGAVAQDIDRVIVLKNQVLFDGTPAELTETGVSLGIHRDDLPLWLEGLG